MAPPASWTGAAAPETKAVQHQRPEHSAEAIRRSAHVEPRGSRWMIAWIAFGVLVAAALIAAAVAFRPAIVTVRERTVPAAEEPAVAEIAAQGVGVATEPGSAIAQVESPIRFRVGPEIPPEQSARIIAALEDAGYAAPRIEVLPFSIVQSRVGFYHPEDRAAAEALADLVAPIAGADREVVIRDYGQLLPDTEAGRLDLWIGN